jgi:hypothetical protein
MSLGQTYLGGLRLKRAEVSAAPEVATASSEAPGI